MTEREERRSIAMLPKRPSPNRWGEVFGDEVVAATMIDRLVHDAEVVALKGDSYRVRNRDLRQQVLPADRHDHY